VKQWERRCWRAWSPTRLNEVLQELERRRLIHAIQPGNWGLARDLDEFTLLELYRLFPGALIDANPDADWSGADDWNRRLFERLAEARESVARSLEVPLKTIYQEKSRQ
jgi:DNA-binding IscR family transcriptional regulator